MVAVISVLFPLNQGYSWSEAQSNKHHCVQGTGRMEWHPGIHLQQRRHQSDWHHQTACYQEKDQAYSKPRATGIEVRTDFAVLSWTWVGAEQGSQLQFCVLWFKISVLPTAQKSGHRELRLCIGSLEHKLHCSDEYIDFVHGEDACICFNEHLENGNEVFSPASWNDCNMVVIISLL